MHRPLLFGALAAALAAPAAHAQVAFPYGLLTQSGYGATVSLGLPDNATALGARVGLGRPTFDASAGFELTSFDGEGSSSATTFGVAGNYYATRETPERPVTVRVGAEIGVTTVEDVDGSILGVVVGGGASRRLALSPTLALVPDGFVGLLYSRASGDDYEDDSNTDLGISLAGHFVIGAAGRFAVTPSVVYNGSDWTPAVAGTLLF